MTDIHREVFRAAEKIQANHKRVSEATISVKEGTNRASEPEGKGRGETPGLVPPRELIRNSLVDLLYVYWFTTDKPDRRKVSVQKT